MATPRPCSVCGTEFPSLDSLGGQCPRCLLELAHGPSAAFDREPGAGDPRRFGDFLLLRRLGAGPLGEVHEVVEQSTGRHLALKTWNAADVSDRGDPLRVPRTHHPGIVTIHGRGQRGDALWVAMELRAEGSLRRWIDATRRSATTGSARRTSFPSHLVRRFAETAQALEHAHRRGAIHGGIKPENLLFADGGRRLAISDFAPANGAAVQVVSWLHGTAASLHYLAPEQLHDAAAASGPGDVHALAACLAEALSASCEIPGALVAVLRPCLSPDPQRRPTAEAFSRSLVDAIEGRARSNWIVRVRNFLQRKRSAPNGSAAQR